MGNIAEFVAGQTLDALIAEKVMEKICTCAPFRNHYGCAIHGDSGLRTYSSSMNAAWEVVEKLVANDRFVFTLENHRYDQLASAEWMVRWMWTHKDHGQWHEIEADTAPLAICLAAIKAVKA